MSKKIFITNLTSETMSSREIAELYGKNHKDVLRKIRKLENAYTQVFGDGRKFTPVEYKDSKGEMRPEILLNKSQALFVASRFDAVLHAKVQKRWEELETKEKEAKVQQTPLKPPSRRKIAVDLQANHQIVTFFGLRGDQARLAANTMVMKQYKDFGINPLLESGVELKLETAPEERN